MNPLARLAAALIIALCLVSSIDPVSAGTALVLELALIPLLRIPWRTFWRRTWPVWLAAPLTAVTIALYGRTAGTVHVEFLFLRISDGSLDLALSTLLRVLAVALPAVVLFIGVDPTELADALAQRLRLPARFVLGALAGVRLIGLAMDDWRSIALARRARGVGDRGAIRRFFGQAFALLVLSIRRGSTLATAMEARGFGASPHRTWARESRWDGRDGLLLGVAAAIGVSAITAAALSGAWRPILG
ncbi:MAG TPA: energy-coupling factor transporter transmembrane component T [Rhodoglobus sp.]|nr:energy-coupling factor transporter transmembrane component T [Rhodoglobus sp.]